MKKNILAVVLIMGCLISHAQTYKINTVAGNGTAGYSGDGGPANIAELYSPNGVAIDKTGNIYVTDPGNHRVRVINNSGSISTFAGNGTAGYSGDGGQATIAEVYAPNSIVVDTLGNVYFSDVGSNTVRVVHSSGVISTIAGTGIWGYSGDGGQATAAELSYPEGIALDNNGDIYISDAENNRIRKVNSLGIISTIVGNGTNGFSGDGGQATAAELNYPYGISIDASGDLFIMDEFNQRLREVNTGNVISTIAGNGTAGYSGDGGPATAAEFKNPIGVFTDKSGNLYVADANNARLRIINNSGVISTIAGNGAVGYSGDGGIATIAELSNPDAVCMSSTGILLIADDGNNTVRELTNVTGVNEIIASPSVHLLYPNPNNGMFTIRIEGPINKGYIKIYNMLGEIVYCKNINEGNTQLDLSTNVAGIYLYEVINETGNISSEGKFIIQK